MVDLKFIRENPDTAKEALKKRNNDTTLIDEIITLTKKEESC